ASGPRRSPPARTTPWPDDRQPSSHHPQGAPQPHRSRRRRVMAIVALCGFVALLIWLNFVERENILGLIDAESDTWQYLAVFFLIVGDAIIPIFPGETTLNAASTLAAQGDLELGLVMLAGALGAIVG